MKRIIFGILLVALIATLPFSIEAKKKNTRKTAQTEKYAALSALERKYVGKHMLSLQWLSWKYFGTVTITKEANGVLTCKGEQLARNCKDADEKSIINDDYLKLDGVIDIVDANHFLFVGEIREKIFHINNGEEVLRQGTYDFKSTKNRKYWRMFPVANPADSCADYIDIYFK